MCVEQWGNNDNSTSLFTHAADDRRVKILKMLQEAGADKDMGLGKS